MGIKIIGYILSLIGIVILAIGTMKPLRAALNFIPESFSDFYIMTAGLIIVAIGIIILIRNPSSQKVSEVPIYQGKDVVGFRVIKKK